MFHRTKSEKQNIFHKTENVKYFHALPHEMNDKKGEMKFLLN